ncbi:PREDICTED: uncharacterized protein LOC104814500 [Tarenaya hassleriana]|uniref:uncharacterized protein LOC104814500 n=1 Tax=Tarenaya hassleriana TaxID=28532 RepID=UPI00053C0F91|nr:PREDICTED: uncharacterized protein LOC104814500 [Tarenaya hassleriana]
MIVATLASFTPPVKAAGELSPRFSELRGLSSITRPYSLISSVKCPCLKSRSSHETTELESKERFSVLASGIPWEERNIWSTFGVYMFCLHIPLSFGGLSIVAYFLHQPVLDPQTQVLSLLLLQMVELAVTVFLLRNTAKSHIDFLKGCDSGKERNWFLGSALGFGFLLSLVFITSIVVDKLLGSEAANNMEVKKIVEEGEVVSRSACFALYCVVAPALEEIVYRRFLLTSLSSAMSWEKGLLTSSLIFAGAHFSGENFVQLFAVGCVLGCCYSWTGNLASSLLLHSLYNAFTLLALQ